MILANSGRRAYGVKNYMVNTKAEMDAIEITSAVYPGSTVLVLDTSERYILSDSLKWVKLSVGSNSGSGDSSGGGGDSGGGTTPNPDDEIIYEGGDLDAM